MFASGVGDDVAIDGLAIHNNLSYTTFLAVRILDGDGIFRITELTLDGVLLGSGGQTGVYLQTVILWFHTEDILADRQPHPCCRTRQP